MDIRTLQKMKIIIFTFLQCIAYTQVYAMDKLDDEALSDVRGQQAAFFTTYIGPDSSNPNPNIGFFSLGLNGTLALNANINRLQLGCGGVNGAGCDIDLSQVSILGVKPGLSGTYADSSLELNNPFIQLAIKNPTSLSTREVVGINLGSQSALGQLSIGMNTNPSNASPGSISAYNNTGINSLSGALTVSLGNISIPNVYACVGVLLGGTCIGANINAPATVAAPGNTNYPKTATNPNGFYQQSIVVHRASSYPDFGPITAVATALGILPLTLSNVHILNEPLSTLHNILIEDPTSTASNPVPTSNLSLSLQRQSITWPTLAGWTPQAAAPGWWLSIPDVVINGATSNQLVNLGAVTALGGILGAAINLTPIDFGQQHLQNCYGGLKFC